MASPNDNVAGLRTRARAANTAATSSSTAAAAPVAAPAPASNAPAPASRGRKPKKPGGKGSRGGKTKTGAKPPPVVSTPELAGSFIPQPFHPPASTIPPPNPHAIHSQIPMTMGQVSLQMPLPAPDIQPNEPTRNQQQSFSHTAPLHLPQSDPHRAYQQPSHSWSYPAGPPTLDQQPSETPLFYGGSNEWIEEGLMPQMGYDFPQNQFDGTFALDDENEDEDNGPANNMYEEDYQGDMDPNSTLRGSVGLNILQYPPYTSQYTPHNPPPATAPLPRNPNTDDSQDPPYMSHHTSHNPPPAGTPLPYNPVQRPFAAPQRVSEFSVAAAAAAAPRRTAPVEASADEVNRRLTAPTHQTVGSSIDTLGVHRQRRHAAAMPSPYALQQHSRASSVASDVAGTDRSSSFITRTKNGVTRQIRAVHRRTRNDVHPESAPPKRMSANDKKTLDAAIEVYISDLSSQNSWPDKTTSTKMATEAIIQANQRAKDELRDTLTVSDDILGRIRHAGSTWRSSLKTYIYESLHLWGLVPTPEQAATMDPADVQEFTKSAIASILKDKKYLHYGLNKIGSQAHFTHPAYHTILLGHWFGPKGIGRRFPHKFTPRFPRQPMALTATMAEIVLGSFDVKTGAYRIVKLNDDHRIQVFDKWVKRIEDMHANEYHRYFLNHVRKGLSEKALATCSLVEHNTRTAVFYTEDTEVDFTLTLPSWLSGEDGSHGSHGSSPSHGGENVAGSSNFPGAWRVNEGAS